MRIDWWAKLYIRKRGQKKEWYLSLSGQNDRNANYWIIMDDLIKTFITPLTHHSWKIFLSYLNSTSCRFLHMNTHENTEYPIKSFFSRSPVCLYREVGKKKNRQRRYPTTILFFPNVHLFLQEKIKSTRIFTHVHTNRHADIALLPALSPSFFLLIPKIEHFLI